MRFVGGQNGLWRGTFGAAGGGLTGPSIRIMANRTAGIAPCNVFFEAAALGIGITSPAHDIRFSWIFSDPGTFDALPEDHPQGRDRNRAYGAMAAHTFTEPGTYQVQLEVAFDGNVQSTTLTIDVADPESVYAGADTFVISPSESWDGAPVDAQQRQSLGLAIADAAAQGRRNARFLLERGAIHDTAYLPQWGDQDFESVQIGAYGTGSRPILSQPVEQIGAALSGEVAVRDLDLRGRFDPNIGNSVPENGLTLSGGAFTTVDNVAIRGFHNGISLTTGTTNIGISNCEISDWAGNGIALVSTDKCAILGTRIGQHEMAQPAAITGGPVRLSGQTRCVVLWQCDLFSNAGGADHAPCVVWNADSHPGACGMIGASKLEGGHPVIQASPVSSETRATHGSLEVDKSYVLGTANAGARGLMTVGYGGTRIRNSIFVIPDVPSESGGDVPAFLTGGHGIVDAGNSAAPITVQSCTFVDLRDPCHLQSPGRIFARREPFSTDHFSNWLDQANLDFAPLLDAPLVAPGGMTEDPIFEPHYLGRRTGPDDLDKSFATPLASTALFSLRAGLEAPVVTTEDVASTDDFFGKIRPTNANAGAVEASQVITASVLGSGDIEFSGLSSGEIDFAVTGTGDRDVSGSITLPAKESPPVFLSGPKALGATSAGSELTAQSGLFLYDSDDGVPATTWEWLRGSDVVSNSATYTVDATDGVFGLRLRQIVNNFAGSVEHTTEVVPQISYEEVPVLANASTLTSPGLLASEPQTSALLFTKFTMPPANDVGYLLGHGGGARDAPIVRSWHQGARIMVTSLAQINTIWFFTDTEHNLAPGDEISLLVSSKKDVGAQWWFRNGAGTWYDIALPHFADMAIGEISIGSRNGLYPWKDNLFRVALWYGIDIDLSKAASRENFVEPTTGKLVHPSVSQTIYGQPAFDFHGDAATWNAGSHDGTLASFTHTGGAFTNAN